MDDYKAKVAKAEARVAELEKSGASPETIKKFEERATKAEQRAKELENEIIFYDYSKSDDFKLKHEKPYEEAWTRAMSELRELTVEDSSGNQRPFNANDMLQLVNLPLPKARELASEMFGDFANDIMNHRKEIRNLLESRNNALEQARKNGSEELRKRMEQKQAATTETRKLLAETWKAFNEEAQADPKIGQYFKPVDGDDAGNAALEKGFKLVDEAWQADPEAEGLTPEQRKEIVRKHTAVRNRAAAFGRMRLREQIKDARIAELEAKLKGYEDSEPGTQGREESPTQAAPQGDKWDGFRQRLLKKAI